MKRIMYIFLNEELQMSVGKAAAQAAHAAALINMKDWEDVDHRTVIVLGAQDEQQLRNIQDYFADRGIETRYVIDESTSKGPHRITAVATESFMDTDEVRGYFNEYSPYRGIDEKYRNHQHIEYQVREFLETQIDDLKGTLFIWVVAGLLGVIGWAGFLWKLWG